MAYSQSNLSLISSGAIDGGGNIWKYVSADPIATVIGAGYIANAGSLAMKVNDIVYVIDTNLVLAYTCFVNAVAAAQNNNVLLPGFNAPGAATLQQFVN